MTVLNKLMIILIIMLISHGVWANPQQETDDILSPVAFSVTARNETETQVHFVKAGQNNSKCDFVYNGPYLREGHPVTITCFPDELVQEAHFIRGYDLCVKDKPQFAAKVKIVYGENAGPNNGQVLCSGPASEEGAALAFINFENFDNISCASSYYSPPDDPDASILRIMGSFDLISVKSRGIDESHCN